MVQLRGVVRSQGSAHRLRRGWLARPGGIVTVDWRQSLRARQDGRFEPAGQWAQDEPRINVAAAEPKRRVGQVPEPTHPSDDSGASAESADSLHLHDQDALHDLSYLPPSVQRSVRTGVPGHTTFVTQALQHTRSDGSYYHTVTGLRLSEVEAVVVVASRQQDSTTWQVELVRYTFRRAPGAPSVGSSTRERLV
ncbi:hypothetical protein [Ornithinimicrobium faecis]|uniref:hypothetical protein n=1 Tax=Ornithinimicrobium faecis TaxID=2934158 RepID=UPI002117366A|nr:hypothetical protein [Ornithinimicrobium sp. HY1745]